MELTKERIDFICRFLHTIFEGHDDCLYISDCGTGMCDLIVSNDEHCVDYSEFEYGTFDGVRVEGHFGCTKAVFVIDGWDYVIKIPYNGSYSFVCDEDELYFTEMPNHIEKEREIYKAASPEMKTILLDNIFAFNYGNLKIYLQKRIEATEEDKFDVKKERWENFSPQARMKATTAREMCHGYRKPTDNFLAALAEQHPDTFFDLIEELDYDDMHAGNYGYLANGMAVIHDYAGFEEYYD